MGTQNMRYQKTEALKIVEFWTASFGKHDEQFAMRQTNCTPYILHVVKSPWLHEEHKIKKDALIVFLLQL